MKMNNTETPPYSETGRKGLLWALRLFMGGMFIYASIHKIVDPTAFSYAIFRYQILPDQLIHCAAVILPWVELLLGLCLIAGFWISGAAFLLVSLLSVFLAALLFNALRGLNIDCGCFKMTGGIVSQATIIWYAIRDSLLLALSILCLSLILQGNGRASAHAAEGEHESARKCGACRSAGS